MRIKQVFIAFGLVALIAAAFSKLLIWLFQSDPQTFGIPAMRLALKLQYVFEIGLLLAVTLICLGLLGRQSSSRFALDRRYEELNSFDSEYWNCPSRSA